MDVIYPIYILNVPRLILQLSLPNDDLVRAVPTGDAPTTFEWSTSLLSTKARLRLDVWRYVLFKAAPGSHLARPKFR